jgi:hypothetical protein
MIYFLNLVYSGEAQESHMVFIHCWLKKHIVRQGKDVSSFERTDSVNVHLTFYFFPLLERKIKLYRLLNPPFKSLLSRGSSL